MNSLSQKIYLGAGASALPMAAPASGVGAGLMAGLKPKALSAPGPAPVMGARPGGLAGKMMGGGGAPAPAAPRAFNAPVQNKLGTMEFKNLQPRGNPQAAGGIGALAAKANGPMSTNGFSSYLDEQIGAAGFKESDGVNRTGRIRGAGFAGGKVGNIVQSGAYKGKTREEAEADLRGKYAAMSPDQKAAYEARGNNQDIGDLGDEPESAAMAAATPGEEMGEYGGLKKKGLEMSPMQRLGMKTAKALVR